MRGYSENHDREKEPIFGTVLSQCPAKATVPGLTLSLAHSVADFLSAHGPKGNYPHPRLRLLDSSNADFLSLLLG